MTIENLTLLEKAALLTGKSVWETHDLPRRGVRSLWLADGPHGVRKQTGAADHLGIAESQPATCFPTAAGVASTWDPVLAEEVGRALGAEAAAQDVDVLLGPGLNIKRSPLGGRNFEYFSEDPLLAGRMAAGYVRGIQSQGVAASPKHFAANSQEPAADGVGLGGRRAHAAGDLPDGVRDRGRGGPPTHDHVGVQPGERHVCASGPVPAGHGAARGVGLRRAGRLGLGRLGRRRGRGGGGRDARDACGRAGLGAAPGDRGPGRPPVRGRPGLPRGRGAAPGRRRARARHRARRGPRRPPRARAPGRRPVRGAAEERPVAAAAGARDPGRPDRRLRVRPAVPGRRLLRGQPHPAGHGRGPRGGHHPRRGRPGARVPPRRHAGRGPAGRGGRGRPWRRRGGAVPGPGRDRRVRGPGPVDARAARRADGACWPRWPR